MVHGSNTVCYCLIAKRATIIYRPGFLSALFNQNRSSFVLHVGQVFFPFHVLVKFLSSMCGSMLFVDKNVLTKLCAHPLKYNGASLITITQPSIKGFRTPTPNYQITPRWSISLTSTLIYAAYSVLDLLHVYHHVSGCVSDSAVAPICMTNHPVGIIIIKSVKTFNIYLI